MDWSEEWKLNFPFQQLVQFTERSFSTDAILMLAFGAVKTQIKLIKLDGNSA